MHVAPKWSFLVLGCCLLAPGVARAQKLEKDDKAFLDNVRPIMLPAEEKGFRALKDKSDRAEFQKIFWARRDPDLETADNSYRTEYEAARAEVDKQIKVAGRDASTTDCGRVFLLLGKPDEVKKDSTEASGPRQPETWTYRDRPGQTFAGGKAAISFDQECKAPPGVADQLNRVAENRIVHPSIDYRLRDGRLTKLVDLLPKPSPSQALLKEPRQDFPIAGQVRFLKVQDGATAVLGLVRGDAAGLAVTEAGGKKTAKVVVAAQAIGEDGKVAAFAEDRRAAEVADGSFTASYRLILKPGKYTLKAGALDEKTGKGAIATTPLEVPNLNKGELSMASIIILYGVDDMPEDAPTDDSSAYGAFLLPRARILPVFGGVLTKKDAPLFFYQAYDMKVNPLTGKADATASFLLLKGDGKTPVGKAPDLPFDQPTGGTAVGPVPLEKYEPGKYVVQVKVVDRVAGRDLVQEVPFEVKP